MIVKVITFVMISLVEGHMIAVDDPDGTSLSRRNSETSSHKFSRVHLSHINNHMLETEASRQLLAERRIAKLKAHLEQAEVRALEQDIRKQVLRAAELKFEAETQSTFSKNATAINLHVVGFPRQARASSIFVKRPASQNTAEKPRHWFSIDSSSIFKDGSNEDKKRQRLFHEELLRVRKRVALERSSSPVTTKNSIKA
mmetsp:Transcript_26372/g.69264  ORF Transcript_26372/g.69264 Transcript_26372/m.69264 type:complete len:199 (+) Transcript_26372:605-1201(+)